MNTPQPEFSRGVSPEQTPPKKPASWQDRIGPAVVYFEANRHYDDGNLNHQLQDWRRENGIPKTGGFSHLVEFPDANLVDAMVWTVHRAFYARMPNDQDPPPTRVLYFVNRKSLLDWIKKMIPQEARQKYLVVQELYDPDWSVTPGLLLVLFGKSYG